MKYKIVFIDDNYGAPKLAQFYVQKLGWEVRHISSPSTFFKKVDINDCDLIITDWELGQEDGLDFCRKIKEDNIKIPVIICSCHAFKSDIQEALKIADDYLVGPFSKNDFVSIVEKWCKKTPVNKK